MIEYTDQQFLYRAVPVDYDGAAKLKRIKGNTLAFNQLVQNGNFLNTNNWTGSITSFTVSNNKATVVCGQWRGINQVVPCVPNHKYLLVATCKQSGTSTALMVMRKRKQNTSQYVDASAQITQTQSTLSVVSTTESDAVTIQVLFQNNATDEKTIEISNVMLIDLTLLNASYITDYNSFKSYFPLSYYPYQSTLLSFNGTAIKTVGKNLLPPNGNTTTTNGVTFTPQSDGSVDISGTASANAYFNLYSWVTTTELLPRGKQLRISGGSSKTKFTVGYRNTDGTGTVFGEDNGNGASITIPVGEYQIYVAYRVLSGVTINETSRPMVRFSDADSTFEPYTSSVTNLPTLTYFPNGMKSAGNVYDELLPNKAITRVGAVNLGSLTWALNDATNHIFEATITDMNPMANYQNNFNFASSMYTPSVLGKADMPNLSVRQASNNSNYIFLKNTSYSNATSFTSAMNNVYLYYELATPTETDINEEIFYRFYQDGTEQILPVNGATPTTAPIWCDIEYYNQIESETPYRKFWLVNGNGERWDLTEKELKSFLENPQGLGFQKTIDVTRYGERAYKNTESYNFPQVTGDVLFYDSANSTRYEKYNEFVRFLMEQPITLHYMIPVSYNSLIADTYSLECEVMSLTKTESKTDRILTSNIQMNGLGFYEGDEIEINGTANTLTINNKGDFPVGFEIELRGTYKNPYFTLEQNGELYGEAKFDDNANNFSSVFVNSKDGEQNVVLKQNNSIMPNPLAYQDLSISNGSIYVTFVKLAKDESTLTIGGDSYTISGYTIRYTPIYRSV